MSENGSDLADELWAAADHKIASYLVYPEARAALAAAFRAERIDRRDLERAASDLGSATRSMVLIGVDAGLALKAGELAEEHALRGYDAVHLATALSARVDDLLVVSWDRDLATAALNCGHAVAPAIVRP